MSGEQTTTSGGRTKVEKYTLSDCLVAATAKDMEMRLRRLAYSDSSTR